jgi:hypothetical protein
MTSTLTDPVNIHIGWSPRGAVFERGWAYQVFLLKEDGSRHKLKCRPFVGYCGVGSRPFFLTIARNEPEIFICDSWVDKWNDGNTYLFFGPDNGYRVDPPCTLVISAKHTARDLRPVWKDKIDFEKKEAEASFWYGIIESNEVVLKIENALDD